MDTAADRHRAARVAALLLPVAATLFFAVRGGGYGAGPVALVSVALLAAAAAAIVLVARPFGGRGAGLTFAVGALTGLALWTLASGGWSGSTARAVPEFNRVVLYLAVMVLVAALAPRPAEVRVMVRGLALAMAAVCGAALLARTAPGVLDPGSPAHPERLAYPLTYWNSLGIFAGITALLCGHLTADPQEPRPVRFLGAVGVPVAAAVLLATDSRGALWATMLAVAIYLVVGRPRGPATASPAHTRARKVLLGVLAVAVGAAAAVALAGGAGGSSRLLSASDNGRIGHWEVALQGFRADRGRGQGAGTYELAWAARRPANFRARDAHSLYVESLGELGVVGLVLVALALAVMLIALAVRARGPDRALWAALLAGGVGWAVHAGIDWDWEMPVTAVWLFAAAGAALARPRAKTAEPRPNRPAVAWLVRGAAVAACVGLAILPTRTAVAEGRLALAADAVRVGDCAGAQPHIDASLRALEQASPHQLRAWCAVRRDPVIAVGALQAALAVDPGNWELEAGLAVALAAAGRNPRGAAQRALLLNPRDSIAIRNGRVLLAASTPRAWRTAARRSKMVLPAVLQ